MQKWKEINTIEEWNQAYNQSGEKPFIILKHSTTCPVSANALKEYEEFFWARSLKRIWIIYW